MHGTGVMVMRVRVFMMLRLARVDGDWRLTKDDRVAMMQ